MDYLAFDIEAANGYKPYSICSIGIVVADEKFNIKHKENIWINPKTKYNLNGTRKNVGIDLHLDSQLIESSPDFTQVYEKIKSFLEGDVQVVGHAVESDVIMLNAACKHYKLPCINFKFVCSQLLFRLYKGEKEVRGLSKIADELQLVFNQHNSMEDALMSMMTLKYLVEQTSLDVYQLMDKYNVRIGENKNFEMTRTVSLDGQLSKRNVRAKAEAKINDYIRHTKFTRASKNIANKKFAIARSIELDNFDIIKPILDAIYSNGGIYTPKLSNCDYYVKNYSKSTDISCDVCREKKVYELEKSGYLQVISLNDVIYMAKGDQNDN